MNEFFTAMTAWVRECGGFVDKFIGDAMLVVFGLFDRRSAGGASRAAPPRRSAARSACTTRLRELNARARRRRPRAARAQRSASTAARCSPAPSAPRDRHEYTVIGDTVNVAARLQQLCKEHGQDFLISETAYMRAAAAGMAPGIEMSDSLALRGRHERVRVYGVAG